MLYILIVSVIVNFVLWINLKDKNKEIKHISTNLKDVLSRETKCEVISLYPEDKRMFILKDDEKEVVCDVWVLKNKEVKELLTKPNFIISKGNINLIMNDSEEVIQFILNNLDEQGMTRFNISKSN